MARFTSPDANGLPGPTGPTGPAGQGVPPGGNPGDILAKIDGTDYNTEWIENYTSTLKHQVKAGVALTKGMAVYVTGSTGNDGTNMIVGKASNASESTSSKTLGLIDSNLSVNDFGYVITEGLLTGLDTNSANVGDPVWLGVNGALIYGLSNKPVAPDHLVYIGVVTRKNQNNGEIFVKPQNGFELDELHTVSLESNGSIADNEVLAFDTASGLWKNQTAAEANLATKGAFNYTQVLGTRQTSVGSNSTILTGSITTNGYPVHIIVTGDAENNGAGAWAKLQLFRGTTAIGNKVHVEGSAGSENIPYTLQFIDSQPAGTYTYSIQTLDMAGGTFNFGETDGPTLCIMELGK